MQTNVSKCPPNDENVLSTGRRSFNSPLHLHFPEASFETGVRPTFLRGSHDLSVIVLCTGTWRPLALGAMQDAVGSRLAFCF